MAEEREDMDFNDPLAGLDLGLLNFDNEGKKIETDAIKDSVRTQFEVKDGDEPIETKASTDEVGKEDDEGSAGNELAFNNKNEIGIREEDSDDEVIVGANDNESSDDNLAMWSAFSDAGLIDLDEGELEDETEKDLEWFASKTQNKITKGIEEAIADYKENLPPEVKYLLDNYEEGVSISDLAKAENKVLEYASIDMTKLSDNENLQKKLVRELLTLQNEDPSDIDEIVEDLEASGLLEKQATRAHKKLVDYQKFEKEELIKQQKQAEIAQREQFNTMVSGLKDTINKKDEIIPGISLNDKQKKQLFNGITKFDKQGKNEVMRFREANPDFDLAVAYLATVLKTDDGKINWGKITEVAETKATKNLKEKAQKEDKGVSQKRNSSLKSLDVNIMKNFVKNGLK